LWFEVLDTADNPVGTGGANSWVQEQSITAGGLGEGQTYKLRVRASNRFGLLTDWYPPEDPPGTPQYVLVKTPSTACPLWGDMNGDADIDGDDVQCFVDCLAGGAGGGCNCDCADMIYPDGFGSEDVAAFVEAILE
jgi:hypothetical protein